MPRGTEHQKALVRGAREVRAIRARIRLAAPADGSVRGGKQQIAARIRLVRDQDKE